MMVKV